MTDKTTVDAKALDRTREKIELWFFRDMSGDQRLALFSLFGMPVDEIGQTHGHQRIALRRILTALSEQPAPDHVGLVERLEKLAVWADRSQHEKWCARKDVPVHGYSGEGKLIREAIAALSRAPEPVAVKPLDWEEIHQRRSDEDPNTEVVGFEANTGFDAWYHIEVRAADFVLHSVDSDRTSTIHETESDAKSAAQADYERHILSSLATPPAPQQGDIPAADGWMCDGCGRLTKNPERDLQELRRIGAISCCPERNMLPVKVFLAK